MRPVEEIEADLARVTAERDALARHIEKLIAPVTEAEADELFSDAADIGVHAALTEFLAVRQRKGQFAALG